MDIPIYYDPIIAKLITHGENREEAISRMIRAINEYRITGIQTTLDFCRFALQHEAFVSGNFDTRFVELYFTPEKLEPIFSKEEKEIIAALAVEFYVREDLIIHPKEALNNVPFTNWRNRLV